MNRSPAASTATPVGPFSSAAVAGAAVAAVAAVPLPATVMMMPRGRDHLADRVVARVGDEQVAGGVERDARGLFSSAAVAGPPSPL